MDSYKHTASEVAACVVGRTPVACEDMVVEPLIGGIGQVEAFVMLLVQVLEPELEDIELVEVAVEVIDVKFE